MRYEKGHKKSTRRHILDVAAKQFLTQGINATGIAGLMKEAKLTNGAFYAHFASKDELVAEILKDLLEDRERQFTFYPRDGVSLAAMIQTYLSPLHRDLANLGCPSAALLSELVRHSENTRSTYTLRLEKTFAAITLNLTGQNARTHAIAIFSMVLGALQLARVVTDPELSDDILKNAAAVALSLARSGEK
ncbi:MAG: TetR/AcrR family transcriptional regulator [Chitinophagaceae bacterium]|nr:TetR/AcrR family transcriptional regulator [Oligoflexus sp.]